MKKKILYGIVAMMTIALGSVKAYEGLTQNNMSALMMENIEALTNGEATGTGTGSGEGGGSGDDFFMCYNGGPGSQSCSIAGGIEIVGVGVTAACSVSCYEGYYACCGIRCQCR